MKIGKGYKLYRVKYHPSKIYCMGIYFCTLTQKDPVFVF